MRDRAGLSAWRPGRATALAVLALAALACLAVPERAQAQTVETLVSNLGQTSRSGGLSAGSDHGVTFRTGANASGTGFTLTSIEISVRKEPGSSTGTVKVYEESGGSPTSVEVATLTGPTNLTEGVNLFTAPANTDLDEDTTYYVIINLADNDVLRTTASTSEDSGGKTDWSIGNSRYFSGSTSTGIIPQIRVKGTVKTTSGTDTTAPRVTSIVRKSPPSSPTNADDLVWWVTFSEAVSNVNAADFSVSGTTGDHAAFGVVAMTRVYAVIVSGGDLADLDATVTLAFASGQDIEDAAGNALTNTTPTGTNENDYVVDNTAPTVVSISVHYPHELADQ